MTDDMSLMDRTNDLFSGELGKFMDDLAGMRSDDSSLGEDLFHDTENPLGMLAHYAPLVEQGNSRAQTLTANILLSLRDDSKTREAVDLLENALAQNDYWASYLLGNMYFRGDFKEQDKKRAVGLYEMSARKRNIYAALLLGHMYENGIHVARDTDAAFEYYRIASVSWDWHDGKCAAISLLVRNPDHEGFCHFTHGFRMTYLTALAEEGMTQAQALLADILFRGAYGFQKHPAAAIYWADRAIRSADMPDDPFSGLFSVYLAFARVMEDGRCAPVSEERRKLENACRAQFLRLRPHWEQDVLAAYCKPWFDPIGLQNMIALMM